MVRDVDAKKCVVDRSGVLIEVLSSAEATFRRRKACSKNSNAVHSCAPTAPTVVKTVLGTTRRCREEESRASGRMQGRTPKLNCGEEANFDRRLTLSARVASVWLL